MPYKNGKKMEYGKGAKKKTTKAPKRNNSLSGRRKAEQDKKNMRR